MTSRQQRPKCSTYYLPVDTSDLIELKSFKNSINPCRVTSESIELKCSNPVAIGCAVLVSGQVGFKFKLFLSISKKNYGRNIFLYGSCFVLYTELK